MRAAHHRRAHSEVNFRLPEDLDLGGSDPFGGGSSFEEMGSEDDLFSTYMDMEKLSAGGGSANGEDNGGADRRPRHRHSNSVDSSNLFNDTSTIEAKKAMAPDKLAELWTIDPKRAKRSFLFRFLRSFFVSELLIYMDFCLILDLCLNLRC